MFVQMCFGLNDSVKLLCVNLWLSASAGRAGLLPSCRLEFLYWLFESALSRSLPTQSSPHQRSPKSVTQIWHCITGRAPWNDMYIMCNIVHIYSLDYPQSINTLIYSAEKIEPKITALGFFYGKCIDNKCRCIFIRIFFWIVVCFYFYFFCNKFLRNQMFVLR